MDHVGVPHPVDIDAVLEDSSRIDKETRKKVRGDERYPTQTRPVSRGSVKGGRRGTIVYFDEDTFEEIRQRAQKEQTSFGEQVRLLVEWGLEDAAQEHLK